MSSAGAESGPCQEGPGQRAVVVEPREPWAEGEPGIQGARGNVLATNRKCWRCMSSDANEAGVGIQKGKSLNSCSFEEDTNNSCFTGSSLKS